MKIAEYNAGGLRLTLLRPPRDLAPYLFGCYLTEVEPGVVIEDWLPPEEANLRTGVGEIYEAAMGDAPLEQVPHSILSGPTDRSARLRVSNGKYWGIGLSPAGWARFVGIPVSTMVNRFCDIGDTAAPPELSTLLQRLSDIGNDLTAATELIVSTFRGLLEKTRPVDPAVAAVHVALLSEDVSGVADLVELAGMKPRTFERFCARYFGFTPRVLLRRQRFLRSLGQYILDPSMKWIGSLDGQYWDQAHFIRDFRRVMYMTPSDYAALPHPLCKATVHVIYANVGVPMQSLFHPDRQPASETGL